MSCRERQWCLKKACRGGTTIVTSHSCSCIFACWLLMLFLKKQATAEPTFQSFLVIGVRKWLQDYGRAILKYLESIRIDHFNRIILVELHHTLSCHLKKIEETDSSLQVHLNRDKLINCMERYTWLYFIMLQSDMASRNLGTSRSYFSLVFKMIYPFIRFDLMISLDSKFLSCHG